MDVTHQHCSTTVVSHQILSHFQLGIKRTVDNVSIETTTQNTFQTHKYIAHRSCAPNCHSILILTTMSPSLSLLMRCASHRPRSPLTTRTFTSHPSTAVSHLSPSDILTLFTRLTPLALHATSQHTTLLHSRSTSQLQPHQHSRLRTLAPIANLTRSFLSIHSQIEEANAILEDPESDTDLITLARDESTALHAKSNKAAASLVSHLIADYASDLHTSTDDHTSTSAILEIRAGTGGSEAALFVADLYQMYARFATRHTCTLKIISQSDTSIGGLREIILRIRGNDIFNRLRLEVGVHRVQRVPETETGGRIHTSTASVAVLKDNPATTFKLREADVKIDVYRASGAGGQHVNKTESAVRATHIPTGLVATSQDDRSQHRNRALALESLAARLSAKHAADEAAAKTAERRAQLGATAGERSDRIRTYNYPQRRVTDHRIVPDAALLALIPSVKDVVGGKSEGLLGVLEGGVELDRLIDAVRRASELEILSALLEMANGMRNPESDKLTERVAAHMSHV